MATSSYWKLKSEIKRLEKEDKKRKNELELLRKRDALKHKVKRKKKEKFYRSKLGRITTTVRKATALSPEQKKSLRKDILKTYKSITG